MQRRKNDFSRREFLTAIGGAGAVFSLASAADSQTRNAEKTKEMLVYIGTYTSGKSKSEGIYIYKFSLETGALRPYKTIGNVVDPSFLAIDKNRKYLYAVNETVEYEGKKSGAVSAFAIDPKNGELHFLNKQPSLGGAPCHMTISDNGRFVLVANYLGGNVSVFPIENGGNLGAAIDSEQHAGAGLNRERQEAPRAHSIILDENNRFAFASDLGIDKIMIYNFDAGSGKLERNAAQPFYQTKAGAGPRHFKFHPNGKFAFVVNEQDSTITSLEYDDRRGTLKEIQTVSTLPATFFRANSCADIHASPDGRFLYGSNRGHDSIAAYKIDEKTGRLDFIEHASTLGRTPRNFAIDPTGRFLLAANQNSDSIVTFRLDEKTGKLLPTGNKAVVPSPVCLKLIP
ncbi:MAG TPA: lactonase family protein, partial [Pyrinomonadaceae bacterium]